MKLLKNNLKVIIGFFIGVILASGITAYAYICFASDIKYTREGTEISNVEDALNDLYSIKTQLSITEDNIYPYQKFILTKDTNGYVFTLKIYDGSNNKIYETTYDCTIWGVFSSTIRTYTYNNKTYTLVAYGTSAQNNFIGVLKCDGYDLFNVLGYSSRDNGSWDTNTTTIMKQRIKFQNVLYYPKD